MLPVSLESGRCVNGEEEAGEEEKGREREAWGNEWREEKGGSPSFVGTEGRV